MALTDEQVLTWLEGSVAIPEGKETFFINLVRENCCFPHQAQQLMEQFFAELEFDDQARQILQQAGAEFFAIAAQAVGEHGSDFAAIKSVLMEKLSIKGKKLFMPLRISVTGQQHGPDMTAIFSMFTHEQLRQRFIAAKQLVEEESK